MKKMLLNALSVILSKKELLNKKIELHKKAIKRLEKMIRYYKTLI